jgi:hypothetical protein
LFIAQVAAAALAVRPPVLPARYPALPVAL